MLELGLLSLVERGVPSCITCSSTANKSRLRLTLPPTPSPSLQLGLIAMVLTALSPLLGVGSFKRLGIITKFPEPWQPRIKWIHRLVGGRVEVVGGWWVGFG